MNISDKKLHFSRWRVEIIGLLTAPRDPPKHEKYTKSFCTYCIVRCWLAGWRRVDRYTTNLEEKVILKIPLKPL